MQVVIEGNCYVSGRLERCAIGIDDGKIVKIAKTLEGDKVYRYGTKIVLPAATDAHVHFREPGMTEKEDFATGSLAAIMGGVTCVLDMPNTKPATTSLASLRDKRALASSKSLVDFGLFAGVKPGIKVQDLAPEAIGFKMYLGSTTGDLLISSLGSVTKELAEISRSNKVIAVHAEDESMRKKDIEKNLEDHLKNRTNSSETSAIKKAKEACKGCQMHICHVSARESIPLLSNASSLTSEVSPHHLLLDKDAKIGTFGKVNPPLRKREDRQALFQALKEGKIDIIASDHAPHTLEDKEEEFDFAPSGVPGVETMIPLMLQHVKDRHLTLLDIVRRICESPAELYGIRKGRIGEGYDADLMVVDMVGGTTQIKGKRLHSKCGWTPYEGMDAIFPEAVFLRGELMVEDGSLVGERIGRDVLVR